MKAPENLPLKIVKQAKWLTHQQKLIVCQFYPDNPFWVARPSFASSISKPLEPLGPRDLVQHANNKQALEGVRQWLGTHMNSEYRARAAWIQNLNPSLTAAARSRSSKAVGHITRLREQLQYPRNLGLIFPEGLEIIIDDVKAIWVPEPLQQTAFLPGTWKRYDFDSHIEYARLS